jgi:hypothetical protein
MRNHMLDHKIHVVWKKMLVVLLLILFTMVSSAATAYAQQRQDIRSPLIARIQQTPPPGSPTPRHHKHHKFSGSAELITSPTPSVSPTPEHHKSSGNVEPIANPVPSESPTPEHHKYSEDAEAPPPASPTPRYHKHHKSSGSAEAPPPGSPTPSEHPGQHKPAGNAELSWNSQSHVLAVTLHASGLQPGSSYAAHIHTGTCSAKGKILYPFKDITADKAGNATLTTTIDNVTGGIPATDWNVTIHRGATAETGTLLCGDVANPRKASSVSVPLHPTP